MTSFPARFAALAGAIGLFVTAAAAAQQPDPQKSAGPGGTGVFSLTLQGRDVTVSGAGEAAVTATPRATGAPLAIAPTPYLTEDEISGLRMAQADVAEETQEGFEASSLDPLGADAVGLPAEGGEGFALDLWQNSNPEVLMELVAALPAGTGSPAANALKRKALLSAAPFPAHFTGTPGAEDFLEARLERLYAAGDLDSLMQMFDQIPKAERSPALLRLMAEVYLLDGDLETACRLAEDGRRTEGATRWLKINTVCLALDGKDDEARFNISLLRETGEADSAFLALFEDVLALDDEPTDAAQGGPADDQVPSFFNRGFYLLSDLKPLHIAILKLLGREIDISIDDASAPNVVLASLARWPGLSLETKLLVADEALKRGILEESFLKDLVGAYTFSDTDKANAYLLDYESWGLKSDALFYALAREAGTVPETVANIQEGWSRARVGGRGPFIANLYFEAMAGVPAVPQFLPFAPDAVRIALLSHHDEVAFGWYTMVRNRAAAGDADATRMLVEMWPLMIAADLERNIPYSPQILRLWRRSLELLTPEEQLGRSALLYEILGILGHAVPEDMKSEVLLTLSEETGVGAFIGGASLGETILKVLIALGPDGTRDAASYTIGDVMFTLDQAGLAGESRHIALEALLVRGF